jgi:sugar lactone lactonase YvrE
VLLLALVGKASAQQYVISTIAGGSDPITHMPKDANVVSPAGIATDGFGNVYFSSPNIVFKLDSTGAVTRFAGAAGAGYSGDGGLATDAQLNFPAMYPERQNDPIDFVELVGALATDSSGNVFIADAYNNRVRKVDTNGIITTVAGTGDPGNSGDGGLAIQASFWWPQGVGADPAGNLYIADGNGALRQVTQDGVITTLTTNNCGPGFRGPGLCAPEQIAVDAFGDIFVPDAYCRVRRISADRSVVTVAGNENRPQYGFVFSCGYTGDGPATSSSLSWPFSVAVDQIGNLYIADTYNSCIRRVDTIGALTTIAGSCGAPGYSGDGDAATRAQLNLPHGIALDAAGNIYVADTGNHAIRLLSALAADNPNTLSRQ